MSVLALGTKQCLAASASKLFAWKVATKSSCLLARHSLSELQRASLDAETTGAPL